MKRKAQRTRDRIHAEEKVARETLVPLIAKINGIQDVADVLLRVGYEKLEHIEEFLVALTNAEGYFDNGGTLFSSGMRKKHVVKLDELIAACEKMINSSDDKMSIFKAVIVGGAEFTRDQANIDGDQYTNEIAAEIEAELAAGLAVQHILI